MVVLKFFILMFAILATLLCVSKLIIEIVAVVTGSYDEKNAQLEGNIRMVLMVIMSILWSSYIVFF